MSDKSETPMDSQNSCWLSACLSVGCIIGILFLWSTSPVAYTSNQLLKLSSYILAHLFSATVNGKMAKTPGCLRRQARTIGVLLTIGMVSTIPNFWTCAEVSSEYVFFSSLIVLSSLFSWTSAVSGLGILERSEKLKGVLSGIGFLFILEVVPVFLALRSQGFVYYEYHQPRIQPRIQGRVRYNDKPVIYLYPTHRHAVDVRLALQQGSLTATYPPYDFTLGGWRVIAEPDGSLHNLADQKGYSYLFWESTSQKTTPYDLSKGFVVKGVEVREFLADVLPRTGLLPREYNECIVYWYPKLMTLPLMQIYFAGAEYDKSAPLTINPKPDSILRVFMVIRPLKSRITLIPQTFPIFERKGFTVVEWGGTLLPETR